MEEQSSDSLRSSGGRLCIPTDEGWLYLASVQACQQLGLRRSMGRTGSCLNNAVAESWFACLKVDLVHLAHPG
jgi:transposase InsO family protein